MPRIPRAPLVLCALTLAAAAHRADLKVTRSGGVLGEPLLYSLLGDPGETFVLVISVSQGPIPVALFCPGDPRVIQVGTELQSLATFGVLAGGAGSAPYVVPNNPSYQGVPLYAQGITLGAPCLINDLSSQNAFALAAHDTVHNTLGQNATARQGHTATTLPDGRVLIAGGDEPDGMGNLTPLDTLELYDPQRQSFTQLGYTLTTARSTHTATLLADGRVLLLGGYDATKNVVATGDLVDPVAGTVTPIAPMSVPRTQHTATLLANGKVLVTGGSGKFDLSDVLASLAQAHRSAEVYDPIGGSWTAVPDVPLPPADDGIVGHAASRLGNGQVLITGGVVVNIIFGIPIPSIVNECYRFEPATSSWVATASMALDRVYHGQITLADGTAAVVGGADGDFVALTFSTLTSVARYDAATNSWTAVGSLNHGRAYPNLVLTPSELVVVGGLGTVDVATASGTPEQNIEVAPTSLLSWTSAATMLLPREVGRAAAVDGGERILIVGTGDDGVPAVDKTAEVYVR